MKNKVDKLLFVSKLSELNYKNMFKFTPESIAKDNQGVKNNKPIIGSLMGKVKALLARLQDPIWVGDVRDSIRKEMELRAQETHGELNRARELATRAQEIERIRRTVPSFLQPYAIGQLDSPTSWISTNRNSRSFVWPGFEQTPRPQYQNPYAQPITDENKHFIDAARRRTSMLRTRPNIVPFEPVEWTDNIAAMEMLIDIPVWTNTLPSSYLFPQDSRDTMQIQWFIRDFGVPSVRSEAKNGEDMVIPSEPVSAVKSPPLLGYQEGLEPDRIIDDAGEALDVSVKPVALSTGRPHTEGIEVASKAVQHVMKWVSEKTKAILDKSREGSITNHMKRVLEGETLKISQNTDATGTRNFLYKGERFDGNLDAFEVLGRYRSVSGLTRCLKRNKHKSYYPIVLQKWDDGSVVVLWQSSSSVSMN